MGDALASFSVPATGVTGDAVTAVQRFVEVFIYVYILLILLYILSSWVPRPPYALNPFLRFLHDVCDPYLRLFRRIIPPIGPVDLSPIPALAVLYALQRLLVAVILARLH